MPTPIAKRTVPKYKYPCLMIIVSGVGIKYMAKSRTLPIVRIFNIVPKNGFCFNGIQPSKTIKPVKTPANPILTLINLLKPSWKTSQGLSPSFASIVKARPKPHKNNPKKH